MTNIIDNPNKLSINSPHQSIAWFGAPFAAIPVHHVAGQGHNSGHISVHFKGGIVWDLDLPSAQELVRLLPPAIKKLPATPLPDVSGAVADLENQP